MPSILKSSRSRWVCITEYTAAAVIKPKAVTFLQLKEGNEKQKSIYKTLTRMYSKTNCSKKSAKVDERAEEESCFLSFISSFAPAQNAAFISWKQFLKTV